MTEDSYLNHYTLTTGHNRKSYLSEVDISLFPLMMQRISPAIGSPVPVPFAEEGCYLQVERKDLSYIAVVYVGPSNSQGASGLIPLLTTGGAKDEESKLELIQRMIETYALPIHGHKLPDAPIIIDRIDVSGAGALPFLPVYRWTADFSRCLAWLLLYPQLLEGLGGGK